MAKLCAYCGKSKQLTREHIWPNGFLKRGGFDIKFSGRANKTFTGDLTISDVCATCNSGPLSKLDAHACELYDRRFSKSISAGAVVTFTYDYGLLMRWLLKVSYNSARTTGQDEELLSHYRDTILCANPCTPVFAVAFLATIAPSKAQNPNTGEIHTLQPVGVARCGPVIFPDANIGDFAMTRCVMINAYSFTLLVTRSTRINAARMSAALPRIPGQPLAFDGRMRVGPPSIPAHVALEGIQNWPDLLKRD